MLYWKLCKRNLKTKLGISINWFCFTILFKCLTELNIFHSWNSLYKTRRAFSPHDITERTILTRDVMLVVRIQYSIETWLTSKMNIKLLSWATQLIELILLIWIFNKPCYERNGVFYIKDKMKYIDKEFHSHNEGGEVRFST